MRIGLFTDQYYPYVSGVVTSLSMLYDGLTEMGHEVFIFVSTNPDLLDDSPMCKKNIINLAGHPYPFKGLKDYYHTYRRKRFVKIIKQYNLDVIHLHTDFNMGKVAIKAHKALGIPMVRTMHTLLCDYFKYFSPFLADHAPGLLKFILHNMYMKAITKNCEVEVVPTNKTVAQKDDYAMGDNIKVIPTGIDVSRFSSPNLDDRIKELKEKYKITDDLFVYLFVGRISKEKSIDVLLKAYAESVKDNPKTRFLIVGGGPDLDDLKKLTKELEIEDKVIYTDTVMYSDIAPFYHLGNVFMNASVSETQGITYIEALASGLPLLVQADDCLEGFVENYYNGILFDGIEDLKQKMVEVLNAPETLKTIKNNTIKSAQEFSKENYCKKILAVYNEAIEKYSLKHNK